jgi:hypothetical protein
MLRLCNKTLQDQVSHESLTWQYNSWHAVMSWWQKAFESGQMWDNCSIGSLLAGWYQFNSLRKAYCVCVFCFVLGPGQDQSHIIPNPIVMAVRSLIRGHSYIATRKYATKRARRAQEFLKGDQVLVLVTALNWKGNWCLINFVKNKRLCKFLRMLAQYRRALCLLRSILVLS